jgi:hypothetical protein
MIAVIIRSLSSIAPPALRAAFAGVRKNINEQDQSGILAQKNCPVEIFRKSFCAALRFNTRRKNSVK